MHLEKTYFYMYAVYIVNLIHIYTSITIFSLKIMMLVYAWIGVTTMMTQ